MEELEKDRVLSEIYLYPREYKHPRVPTPATAQPADGAPKTAAEDGCVHGPTAGLLVSLPPRRSWAGCVGEPGVWGGQRCCCRVTVFSLSLLQSPLPRPTPRSSGAVPRTPTPPRQTRGRWIRTLLLWVAQVRVQGRMPRSPPAWMA